MAVRGRGRGLSGA